MSPLREDRVNEQNVLVWGRVPGVGLAGAVEELFPLPFFFPALHSGVFSPGKDALPRQWKKR